MPVPAFQTNLQFKVRETKREKIEALFTDNIGLRYSSGRLHLEFGTAFRSRVSEINRDSKCPITIKNATRSDGTREYSEYWSEVRA